VVVVVVPFGPDSVTVTVVTVGILSRNNVMNRNHDGTLRTTVIMQYAIYYTKKKSDFLAVSATAHITVDLTTLLFRDPPTGTDSNSRMPRRVRNKGQKVRNKGVNPLF